MKTINTIPCALILSCLSPAVAEERMIEMVPATRMTTADAARLKEVNDMLHKREAEVARVMEKEGLKPLKPQMPNYPPMTENSVRALLNQIDYTNLAAKVGAEMPPRPNLESGIPIKNNRFLHFYNNAILRSIAKKLGVEAPAAVDLTNGSVEEHSFNLVKQNSDIVHLVAMKLGVSK